MHTLLTLPRELRDSIICHILLSPPNASSGLIRVEDRAVQVNLPSALSFHHLFTASNLLLTNWQLHHETADCIQRLRPKPQMDVFVACRSDDHHCKLELTPEWRCLPCRKRSVETIELNLHFEAGQTYETNVRAVLEVLARKTTHELLSYMVETCTTTPEANQSRNAYSVKCINIHIFPHNLFESVREMPPYLSETIFKRMKHLFVHWPRPLQPLIAKYAMHPDKNIMCHRKMLSGLVSGRIGGFHTHFQDATRKVRRIALWLDGEILTTYYVWGRRYGRGRRRRLGKKKVGRLMESMDV